MICVEERQSNHKNNVTFSNMFEAKKIKFTSCFVKSNYKQEQNFRVDTEALDI